MPYAILSAIGAMYKTEAGNVSVDRFPALEFLAKSLRVKLKIAEDAKAAALDSTAVAKDVPKKAGLNGERVKALVAFHQEKTGRWTYLDTVNAEVIKLRKWLSRQGAHQTAGGEIIWSKSARKVEYDSSLEQQGLTRITFQGGLMHLGGKPFDTSKMVTHFSGPNHAIYVMSKEGNFHVSSHAVGHRHHSSLLGGQPVACAGEMKVQEGRLMFLSNKSGHYHPDKRHFFQTLAELRARDVPMTFAIKTHPDNETFAHAQEFLEENYADDAAFDAQQVLKAVNVNDMARFLSDRNLAFLTKNRDRGVNTTGFHTVNDGYPYWRSADEIRQMLVTANVPMTHYIATRKKV